MIYTNIVLSNGCKIIMYFPMMNEIKILNIAVTIGISMKKVNEARRVKALKFREA